MSWRILLLLAVAPGCAHGRLVHTTRCASGQESSESYEYHEAKLSRAEDGGWTVELSGARYRGPKLQVPWPILILGVRVYLPADIEEGRAYLVADPDEGGPGECAVELGHVFVFSCTWLPAGPGTVRITRLDPARRRLSARFEIRESRVAEGGEDVRAYRGSFDAWR